MYSVYSWGCPLFISLIAIVVEYLPQEYDIIRPGFGDTKCWFENRQSMWAFFYGFVLVLVVLNIVFFCWVAWILIMAQNDPILQRTRQQNRERMWLYVKLFLVMGLTWITEVISWQEGSCEAWIATDIINSLQGFSIFLIFICKRNMIKRIRTNWEPYLRRVKELFGPSRPPPSTRQAVHDTSSFSSSVQRPSQSNASQRTVQSQISLDPTTASRKLSTTSLGSLAGAPVHATSSVGSNGTPLTFSNSLSMDTITEATHQEAEEEEAAMQNQTEVAQKQGQIEQKQGQQGEQKQGQQGEQKQGQGEQKQGQVEQEQGLGEQKQGQGEQKQGQGEDEKQDIEKKEPSQEIDRLSPASLKVSEPRTNDMTTEQMSPEEGSNHNTSNRVQTHPRGDTTHNTENTRLNGRVSPSQVEIDMPSDSPGQQEIDTQLRAPTSRDTMVNGALKASDEMVPVKTIEDRVSPPSNDNLEGNNDTVITPAPAGEDAIGSKRVPLECYNRAFTTDDDDDLPIEV
ncbi:hypothetical protein Pmani_037548 [Petrolisthes manimaculis]|uniref:G-protein coupled receptors family 2 profile 2 domain-containing protein n=1 Tax=Petrolisthes manimaculis TaxID=1843537 RepID=A0AAE1NGJ6_9EUCA|nr:hypothetical protein Pmani_037548 [Petrolisthes manimaculis]